MTTTTIHLGQNQSLSEKLLGKISNPTVILAIWFGLFAATFISSDLDARTLFSAFFAWCGGLVTARLDYIIREERNRKNNVRIF